MILPPLVFPAFTYFPRAAEQGLSGFEPLISYRVLLPQCFSRWPTFDFLNSVTKASKSFYNSEDSKSVPIFFSCFTGCGAIPNFVIFPEIILVKPGNTNGGSITVQLTSCLTGLE